MSISSGSSNSDFVTINMEDAASVTSSNPQLNDAIRESVLTVLASPEQMEALSHEDRQRIEQLALTLWPAASAEDVVVESAHDISDGDGSVQEPEVDDATRVTNDEESLTRTIQLLHEESGTSILTDLPRYTLFDIIKTIANIVSNTQAQEDEDLMATMELLTCSSVGNLTRRLDSWPLVNQRLNTCADESEFKNLLADTMHELRERNVDNETETAIGEYNLGQCDVCCSARDTLLWSRGCCDTPVCVACLHRWLITHLTDIRTDLTCPGCEIVLKNHELRHLLSETEMSRREQLIDRQRGNNKGEKDCPSCSHMTKRPVKQKRKPFKSRGSGKIVKEQGGVLINCEQCNYNWCFDCHSPVHPGVSCHQFRTGAHQLMSWAKKVEENGLRKARQCPGCKVLIEKNHGCNHITCVNCDREFCYLCNKPWSVKQIKVPYFNASVFGSHSSRLSVFGCRETFMPNRPALRRLIRGTLFVLRLLALILAPTIGVAILLPIALALVGIAIPLAPIIVPAVLIYLKCKKKI